MKRFADQLDDQLGYAGVGDCPSCGHGLPGPHARFCPVRAAFLMAERLVTSEAGRKAVTRVVRSLMRKPAEAPEGSEVNDGQPDPDEAGRCV